jgi:hypothetical protein
MRRRASLTPSAAKPALIRSLDDLLINSLKTAFVWERRHSSVGSEQLICNQQVVGSNPTAGSFQFAI